MAQHRYRQNKIKREHTIIDGLLPILEEIAAHSQVHGITPGRISKRTSNRNTTITVQYKTETGLKLLARSEAAVQEVFVVTDRPDEVLKDLIGHGLVKDTDRKSNVAARPKSRTQTHPDTNGAKVPNKTAAMRIAPRAGARPNPDGVSPAARTTSLWTNLWTSLQRYPQTPGTLSLPDPTRMPPAARRRKKPEVADAIAPEVQKRLMSLARQGTGESPPAPDARPGKTNVWRDLLKTHRELLALEESLEDEIRDAGGP